MLACIRPPVPSRRAEGLPSRRFPCILHRLLGSPLALCTLQAVGEQASQDCDLQQCADRGSRRSTNFIILFQ